MKVVLKVRHKDQEKMTGKVFPFMEEDIYQISGSAGNWHRKTRSPGGIDTKVIDFLFEHAISLIYYHNTTTGKWLKTDVEKVLRYAERHTWDGRDRFFLPIDFWEETDPIENVPWIEEVIVL